MSFQLFHVDERLFTLRVSGLELISSVRVGGRKEIQSVKSAWSVLIPELKTGVQPALKGNNKGRKIDAHIGR